MRYRKVIGVGWLVLTCIVVPSTGAEPIGYSLSSLRLTRLDLGTGSFSTVGPTDVIKVAGATIGLDGFIYAVSELSDELWQVDPSTDASSLIGGTEGGSPVVAIPGLSVVRGLIVLATLLAGAALAFLRLAVPRGVP